MSLSNTMNELGWERYATQVDILDVDMEHVGRVTSENRTNYSLATPSGEKLGVLRGKTHYNQSKASLPKVGDWVCFSDEERGDVVAIDSVLPRFSKLSRRAAGEEDIEQVMVANVDQVFIVQGLDGNFNLNRLERYLVMVENSGASPVIVLNKADLVDDVDEYRTHVQDVAVDVPILALSAQSGQGVEELKEHLIPYSTSVFVGSSGVGKSTLLNQLFGEELQATQTLRDDDQGRHTTTRRELFVLPNGAIIIDTPGMRELKLQGGESASDTFAELEELALQCRYRDCDHEKTDGCALIDAAARGDIDEVRFENYLKLGRELDYERGKEDHDYGIERKARIKKTQKGYKKILQDKYGKRGLFE